MVAAISYEKQISRDRQTILAAKVMLALAAISGAIAVASTNVANAAPDSPGQSASGPNSGSSAQSGGSGSQPVASTSDAGAGIALQPEATIHCNSGTSACFTITAVPPGTYWEPALGEVDSFDELGNATFTGVAILPNNCTQAYQTHDAAGFITGQIVHCV